MLKPLTLWQDLQ